MSEMAQWKKKIIALFERHPQLDRIIKNPVYYSDTPWAGNIARLLSGDQKENSDGNFYRVVFPQGAPKNLMSITTGQLSGLSTTSIVEKGRIVDVAGLKPVDSKGLSNFFPMLLTLGMFGAINSRLEYISNVCTDIRNRQLTGDYARLEKVSEVILDCFESIPEMDSELNRINIGRIVSISDECLEILILLREELKRAIKAKTPLYSLYTERSVQDRIDHRQSYSPVSFLNGLMQHDFFAAYERLIAAKICQIALTGSYSKTNIDRCRNAIIRQKDQVWDAFSPWFASFRRGSDEYRYEIQRFKNEAGTGYAIEELEREFSNHMRTVEGLEQRLKNLLDSKLDSFDLLYHLADKEKIKLYLIDGAIVIDN